jgi:uncharacterized membrane protein
MNLLMFILIWVFVFIALISFLPAILYLISLLFNWFKPQKKVKSNANYTLAQFKEVKGKIQ